MFTPQEVSDKTFPKASSFTAGYDLAAVDEFLDALTEDYTALYKENAALKTKLKILAEKVEEYRTTEDSMRSMLLAAQKMSDSLTAEAKEKSEKLLADARQESEKLLAEAKNSADVINRDLAWKTKEAQEKYAAAKAAMEDFVAQGLAMCHRQAEYLEQLPHSELPASAEPAVAPSAEPAPAAESAPAEEAAPAEETAPVTEQVIREEPAAEDPVMSQDTIRIIEKDILAAYEEQQKDEEKEEKKTEEPLPADTDFRSEFKLDLDELKFGRNYDPGK